MASGPCSDRTLSPTPDSCIPTLACSPPPMEAAASASSGPVMSPAPSRIMSTVMSDSHVSPASSILPVGMRRLMATLGVRP